MKTLPMPSDPPAPSTERKRGGLARVVEWLVGDAPTEEEVRRRIRSKPGFFASLSPEAREAILSYDGPINMGPPGPRS
jgi:hypothetical protein